MKAVITMKVWGAQAIIILLAGCVSYSCNAATADASKAAYGLMQQGKVDELRKMLAEDPSIANTNHWKNESLLNIVIDTRPAFPNMYDSIEVLLEAGADPNMHAPQLLRKAIWRREPEVFKLLLEYGADPNIIWTRKNINMLEYSRSYGDKRFDEITDAWENAHQQ